MKIMVIIPTIRPEKLPYLFYRINRDAGIPKKDFTIFSDIDTNRIGCPKMVNLMVQKTESDMVCFLGDDTCPQKDFLSIALEKMKRFKGGWGLVGLGDGTKRDLPCHWLGSRQLLPHLDYEFFHTGYKHCYCDNELMIRCKAMDKFEMAHDALVLHNHPLIYPSVPWDEDYERVYSDKYSKHDSELFKHRFDNNWRTVK